MNKKGFIPAFSITEVLVSLVISAIIVGITFVLFTIVSDRMYDFRDQNQFISDLNRLTYSVNKDIFECEKILIEGNGLVLYTYSGEKTAYYSFEDQLIRRKEDFADTFKIVATRLKLDTLYSPGKRTIYQRLQVDVSNSSQLYDLKFFRKIHSNSLMEKTIIP